MKKLIAAAALLASISVAASDVYVVQEVTGDGIAQPFCITPASAAMVLTAVGSEAISQRFTQFKDCAFAREGLRYRVIQHHNDYPLEGINARTVRILEPGFEYDAIFFLGDDVKEGE